MQLTLSTLLPPNCRGHFDHTNSTTLHTLSATYSLYPGRLLQAAYLLWCRLPICCTAGCLSLVVQAVYLLWCRLSISCTAGCLSLVLQAVYLLWCRLSIYCGAGIRSFKGKGKNLVMNFYIYILKIFLIA